MKKITYIKIGDVEIEKTAALAPMASVADYAYRKICMQHNACFCVGEMASSKGLCYSDAKTAKLLATTPEELPMAIQLFGCEPDFMAKAVAIASEYKPQIIDVNMGCPVPKVAGNGSGSALMKKPELAYDIIKAMTQNTNIPITVKIRTGWDKDNINAPQFAKLMQDAGASAITIHGRTREQMYKPPIDFDTIRAVKQAVSIPVIGNGGITSGQDALHMYEYTGCDLVMVGQGSYGRPWIFEEIRAYLQEGILLPPPSTETRIETMLQHVKLIVEQFGEDSGMKQARKHAVWYLKGIKSASIFRKHCATLTKYSDLQSLVAELT